jgi:hypothetical protein
MPTTPRKHFDEDLARAEKIWDSAETMRPADDEGLLLQSDLWHSSVALSVGAMDAFLCDAYVDCLTSVLRAYAKRSWNGDLPDQYAQVRLSAGEVLDNTRTVRPAWSLRMAARQLMEKDNMLEFDRLKPAFNGILPQSHRLWAGIIQQLIDKGWRRYTGKSSKDLATLTGKSLENAKKSAIGHWVGRMKGTIQWRHDWIHNCARPRSAICRTSKDKSSARIREVRAFVQVLDDHLDAYRLA